MAIATGYYPLNITATRGDGVVHTSSPIVPVGDVDGLYFFLESSNDAYSANAASFDIDPDLEFSITSATESSSTNLLDFGVDLAFSFSSATETSAASVFQFGNEISFSFNGAFEIDTAQQVTFSTIDSITFGTAYETDSANLFVFDNELYFSFNNATELNAARIIYLTTPKALGYAFEFELQKSIYNVLSTDVFLLEEITGVYDISTKSKDFPYVTIGEALHTSFDTDDQLGFDVSIDIHAWSRYNGNKEIKQIQSAIYRALNRQTFTILGYNLITCDFVNSTILLDPDGKTRQSIQSFRILANEVI